MTFLKNLNFEKKSEKKSQLRKKNNLDSDFFSEMKFFQKYIFFGWIFSIIFFRSDFFWGVISKQKLVLFPFMGFSGRFRHSFTLFGANFGSASEKCHFWEISTSKEKKWSSLKKMKSEICSKRDEGVPESP